MQHLQQNFEELECLCVGLLVDGLCLAIDVGGFHHLQIPARELVPEQFVDSHQRLGNTIFLEQVVDFSISLLQLSLEPCSGNLASLGLFNISHLPAFNQTESVPNLVVEVTTLLAECLVKEDVVAGRGTEHHAHAHTVSTELLYQFDGVGRVA